MSTFSPIPAAEWARRWPAEMIWVVRREPLTPPPGLRQLQRSLAHHSWATAKLIDFQYGLDPQQLRLTAPGTLGLIERTLTHLVSSEQFYLRDLTGEAPRKWIESRIVSLDELAARATENAFRWVAYLEAGPDPDEAFATTWRGKPKRVVRWGSPTQAIVHGTEHRTHVCTILGANGIEPPDLSVGAFEDATAVGEGARA